MHETWEEAVARLVVDRGNHVSLQEIYEEMRKHPLVTHNHLAPWKLGGQPRYECWTRRYLTALVYKGVVKRLARGVYASN